MGRIGNEIVQSRMWIDPSKPKEEHPNLNYKLTFPITVFSAVRADLMDEESETLDITLNQLRALIRGKQDLIPGRPGNELVTYAGTPGAVGSIRITTDIPWDPAQWSDEKIPTEKAVADLLKKYNILDENGSPAGSGGVKVTWGDIIGRPNNYTELGNHQDGFINQYAITKILHGIEDGLVDQIHGEAKNREALQAMLSDHLSNVENPHNVTLEQLGGATKESLEEHVSADNPHGITAETVGLDQVDNTSDLNKPISAAVQAALDGINAALSSVAGTVEGFQFLTDLNYDQPSGNLEVTFHDGTRKVVNIPIDGLLMSIVYDKGAHTLQITDLGGRLYKADLSELYNVYQGSENENVDICVHEDGTIRAVLRDGSIMNKQLGSGIIDRRVMGAGAVGTAQLLNGSVTGEKLGEHVIEMQHIADGAVRNRHIGPGAVSAENLFTSPVGYRVLAVTAAGTIPVYTKVQNPMIEDDAIGHNHIMDKAVLETKLADLSVSHRTIQDRAVGSDQIQPEAIGAIHISRESIPGEKLVSSITLLGTPNLEIRPDPSSDCTQIPDTRWVNQRIQDAEFTSENIADRSVDGRKLFSSNDDYKVLLVEKAGQNPVWGMIDERMIAKQSISAAHLMDQSVTTSKILPQAVMDTHIHDNAIGERHLKDQAVTLKKMQYGDSKATVLTTMKPNEPPVYTKIIGEMLEDGIIEGRHLSDHSLEISKLVSSELPNMVLGVETRNQTPSWMKVTGQMIDENTITGRNLQSSTESNTIMAVQDANGEPEWMKLKGEMIQDDTIQTRNIRKGAITSELIDRHAIDGGHIQDHAIQKDHLNVGILIGQHFRKPGVANMVMAVGNHEDDTPEWRKITGKMLDDHSLTLSNFPVSAAQYRVLGTKEAGRDPEYLQITHQFIADGTITPSKLNSDFVLYGHPSIDIDPDDDSNNFQIPSTHWVRKLLDSYVFDPPTYELDIKNLKDFSLPLKKLMTSDDGPRLLGITDAGESVEFVSVEEKYISDGAVTTNKLQRDIHLLGSPVVDVRPNPKASDATGYGDLIPDCQWVLDRINEIKDQIIEEIDVPAGGGSTCPVYTATLMGIPVERINGIVDEIVDPEATPDVTLNGNTIGAIEETRVTGIVDKTVTPKGTGSAAIGPNAVVAAIGSDRLAALDAGATPNPTTPYPVAGAVQIPEDFTCPFAEESIYISPISSATLSLLLEDGVTPTPTGELYINGKTIAPLSATELESLMNGSWNPEPVKAISLGKKNMEPIPLDRIRGLCDGSLSPRESSSLRLDESDQNNPLYPGAISQEYIQDHCVDGTKLFTTSAKETVLLMKEANGNAVWEKMTGEYLKDRTLHPKKMMIPEDRYTVLSFAEGKDLDYHKISAEYLSDFAVTTTKIKDHAVTSDKIADFSINASHLAPRPMVNTVHMVDRSVKSDKIALNAVENKHVKDHSINGMKLEEGTVIPAYTTTMEVTDETRASIRNIYVSREAPSGGQNGDIWIRYI